MKKIGFITSSEDPNLSRDDQLAIEPLKSLGYEVFPLVWDDSGSDLSSYDAFVFRSCWNYHTHFQSFLKWVEILRAQQKPILNSLDVSIWNLNKVYLLELQKKGVSIPKTEWIKHGSLFDSDDVKTKMDFFEGRQIVIRPAVSLNGHDTYLVSAKDENKLKEIWRSMPLQRDIIVQEFIPEIRSSGETSLIFFNGEFSHAIKKIPASDEFRIHVEYGGLQTAVVPSPQLIAEAKEILNLVDSALLFARVDVIERSQKAVLIELEIVDPMLFLGYSVGAPDRFAKAIADRLSTEFAE
jgi:glutathione synthase/RimK-type ligase-like ATP-grasp enzyme